MKKNKQKTVLPPDDRRPTKVSTSSDGRLADLPIAGNWIPQYEGVGKTEGRPQAGEDIRSGPTKPPFEKTGARAPSSSGKIDLGDQQRVATEAEGQAVPRGEHYIRIRLQVRESQLVVLDSHLVEGPLGQTSVFSGANAYEVVYGDRLLHAGVLPDLGVQRSFSNLHGPSEQRGHHFTAQDRPEFVARVGADEVTPETVGQITVRLYRVKGEARASRLATTPLNQQFEREMRPIAELVGLPETVLPEAIRQRGGSTPSVR